MPCWHVPVACPSFRSRSCNWPSSPPISRRARRTSSGGRWLPGGARGICRNTRTSCGPAWRKNGLPAEFAERIAQQIQGFGEYGFPESHAASFALLVYASAWVKRHHPDIFLCGLLNSQPMGFYSPSMLIQDARRHGVTVLPPDAAASDWESTLAAGGRSPRPARDQGVCQGCRPSGLRPPAVSPLLPMWPTSPPGPGWHVVISTGWRQPMPC